ncbi:hypothetical protein ACWGQ5_52940 [Streptomyces sp. NPDC055722]
MPTLELTRPDDAAIAAAMSRTLTALTALGMALGDGVHRLSLVAQRVDHRFARAERVISGAANDLMEKAFALTTV